MRNYVGFFIKSVRKCIYVLKEIVVIEEEFLEDYIVVVSFFGGKLIFLVFVVWLVNFYFYFGSGLVVVSDNIRCGFFCLKVFSKEVVW